jgi:hypothetical protein
MDARGLLDAPAALVAGRILAVWAASGALEARAAETLDALAAAKAGDAAAWPRAAQLAAADARGRLELDAVPGLRTRLWRDVAGGTLPAIGSLLAERARSRAGDGELVQLRGGRVWIPDTALPELAYHLELDARGIGVGWDRDAACADLAAHAPEAAGGADGGLARLWRRWTRWACDGAAAPARAWLSHPGVVGAIPATGLDARAPRLAALAGACRGAPPAAPAVARRTPALLPWCRERVPRARELALLSEAPAHRHLREAHCRAGARAGLACDPVVALPAALARGGLHEPLPALVAALRAGLRVALADAGEPARDGAPWRVALAHQPSLPPLSLCAQAGRLLIDGTGVASLVAWLGWFPLRYARQASAAWTWPWAALEACGWSALAAAGAWAQVRPHGRADGPWFACGAASDSLPRAAGVPSPISRTTAQTSAEATAAATAVTGDEPRGRAADAADRAIPDLLRWSA